MSVLRRVRPALLFVAALCVALPASASGAVTIGSNLEATPTTNLVCGQHCTNVLTALPPTSTAPGGVVATSDGVVVRWRIKVGSQTAPVALRIIRPGIGPDTRTGAGTAPTVTPTADQTSTFDVRLPIRAGDTIGIDCCDDPVPQVLAPVSGAGFAVWIPALQDGETPIAPTSPVTGRELLINADIEPDADIDGYGDETQDQCPTDASKHGDCTPPETEITKGAPNKTDKTKLKFKFTSSEPDSTFECKLDKKAFKACDSPRKVKRLDEGKHKFKVRAIDAAGNVDPSAARDKFKVVG
jgi:hypothetical protein